MTLNITILQHTYIGNSASSLPPSENSSGGPENSNGHDDTDSTALAPAVRRPGPEGKDNDSFMHEDVDKDSGRYRFHYSLHWLWYSRLLW